MGTLKKETEVSMPFNRKLRNTELDVKLAIFFCTELLVSRIILYNTVAHVRCDNENKKAYKKCQCFKTKP